MQQRSAAMRWSAPGWRSAVLGVAVSALLGALFPKVWRSTLWPVGLGRRGGAAYVAVNALVIFAAHTLGRGIREEHEAAVAEARARLGRDPTDRELHNQYGRRMLRRSLGREPTDEELERAMRPDAT
jgi:hypothetical protein